jgi:hypothetical protein
VHRQKAFGLFVRAYEDARRAVLYLRARHSGLPLTHPRVNS